MLMNEAKAFQFCFFIAFQVSTRFLISLFKLVQQKCKCCIAPNPFVKTSLFNIMELISFMHTSSSIISTKSICKKLGGGGGGRGEEERKQRTSRRKSHNKISNKFLKDRKAILKYPEDRAILAKKQSPATSFC